MNKILKISIDSIIINPAEQSDMITDACNHKTKMNATGLCQVGDNILITLEPEEEEREMVYVLSPFSSNNIDEIISEISSRYFAGFSLVGGFDLKSEKWALFARRADENN